MMYLDRNSKQLSRKVQTRNHSENMEEYDAEAMQVHSCPYGYSQAET